MILKQEIEFSTELEIEKPAQLSANEKFYIIYSPVKFKLRPYESIMLNEQLKIKLPDAVQGIIRLSPSLILQKVIIKNCKRVTLETQSELIKVDLLNRNFNNTIKIKKN